MTLKKKYAINTLIYSITYITIAKAITNYRLVLYKRPEYALCTPNPSRTPLNCLNGLRRFTKMTFLATKSAKFAEKRKTGPEAIW